MEKTAAISRVKFTLGNRNIQNRTNESQFNALKTIMSMVHNGGMIEFDTVEPDAGKHSYNIKGMRFDHELDTLEIILQKKQL